MSTPTQSNVRVLALDPGYDRLGLALLERSNGVETLLYSTCVESLRTDAFPKRLRMLGERVRAVITEYAPHVMALEHLYFTNNQKTAMHVAEVRGMLLYIAAEESLEIYEYTPSAIKVAVTGDGRSDKVRMTQMVERLLKLPPQKRRDDEYDAIAVGLTCLAIERWGK